MSSKHFEYMFKQQDEGFFGKVASEVQGKADDHQASLQRDLESDIELLRSSGPVGEGFEFTKRAAAYLNVLADEGNQHLDFFSTAFEKVASAAIQGDVRAMLPGLDKEAQKVVLHEAQELVKRAGGAMALMKGLGEAGKALTHGGGEMALKAVKAPIAGAANMARKATRGLEDARLVAASRSAKKLQTGDDAASGSAAAAENTIGKAFHGGRADSLQSSATKALDSRDKKLTNMVGGRAKKLVPDVGGNVAKAPKAELKAEAPKTETPKAKAETAGEGAPAGGAAIAGPKKSGGIMDSFHKARKEGWGSLDDLEKQKLISAGLGTGLAAHVALSN